MGDTPPMIRRSVATSVGCAFVLATALYGCPSTDDVGDPSVDAGVSSSSSGGSSSGGSSSSSGGSSSSSGGVDAGPSCTDGKKNGAETDTDCGGGTCPKCALQKACATGTDCVSGLCDKNVCVDPSCTDKKKNSDETDVDCGGTKCAGCADTLACLQNRDCLSKHCDANVCVPPTSTDGIQNGTETDVDCGGGAPTNAPGCATGKKCKITADCDKALCTGGTCAPPANNDGIQNGTETDVDCGGGAPTNAPRCATGKMCLLTSDCNNVLCNGATCDPPTSTDGLQNGTETDVDCGGAAPTNAPGCVAGKKCLVANDCASTGCNYAKVCVNGPSCVNHVGGDTCGKGEVGAAGAAHEDCCSTGTLASGVQVDKYEITAGRMRQFISAVGNNVQAWVLANRAKTTQIPDAMVQYLPTGLSTPSKSIVQCDEKGQNCGTVTQGFGVYDHLGNTVFMPDRPCANCGQGCWLGTVAEGGYGHPTYWWPNAIQTGQWASQPRAFSQADLDAKSLNCTTQVLFAAFCAWDGGRLPTQAELGGAAGAWGPASYPWGNQTYRDTVAGAPGRVEYPYAYNGQSAGRLAFLVPAETVGGASNLANAVQYNYTNWNPFGASPADSDYLPYFRYAYPNITAAKFDQTDQAFAIAAPGRMVNDFRADGAGSGWYDVGANLIEVTATVTTTDDANHNGWPGVSWVGGSFEGHEPGPGGYNLNVMTKYGKAGARCAR